jgi:5-methylcytosine-specific restriction endonuclease McrA
MRKGKISEEEKIIIKLMREDGEGYTDIAKRLGCSKDRVKIYCQRNGLGGYRSSKQNNPEKAFELFLENFNKQYGDRYLYIGGYTHSDNDVIIECKTCHTQMSRNVSSVRHDRSLLCEGCMQEQRDRETLIRILSKRITTLAREIRLKEQEEQRQKDLITVCQECGKVFKADRFGVKYCSNKCRIRMNARGRDKKRLYKRLSNGRIDKDITLSKLIKKDNNICHICKGKCNRKDYTKTTEGHFIVGRDYPSIDHVVPVSKGGTHTWDNVKLAHHYCNTIKNNNVIYEEGTGQLKMIG